MITELFQSKKPGVFFKIPECKNCRAQSDNKYCPNCGQKTNISRITLGGLLHDLPHAIFHIDRGILYNLIQLFKRPGPAINEYLEGKRKPFFHPASFLVIALVLNYLVVKITNLHFYDEGELLTMSPLKAQAIKEYDEMQWWFLEHTYIYILFAITASTLVLFGIYKFLKQTYNFAETATIVLFTIAQGVLIQTFIYFCFGWIHSGPFLRTVETINMSILISYAIYVNFQLLAPVKHLLVRLVFSFLAGLGLTAVWVASAYILYLLLT